MKYDDTNCKPIGELSTAEQLKLEHKYRLLLKESGFQDIEAWDNRPKAKCKKVKFIKGHLRLRGKTPDRFLEDSYSKMEFFRIIGIYSHHCTKVPVKYRAVLQDYSISGNMAQSIRDTKSTVTRNTLGHFIKRHLPNMIKFVKEEFNEREESGRQGVN